MSARSLLVAGTGGGAGTTTVAALIITLLRTRGIVTAACDHSGGALAQRIGPAGSAVPTPGTEQIQVTDAGRMETAIADALEVPGFALCLVVGPGISSARAGRAALDELLERFGPQVRSQVLVILSATASMRRKDERAAREILRPDVELPRSHLLGTAGPLRADLADKSLLPALNGLNARLDQLIQPLTPSENPVDEDWPTQINVLAREDDPVLGPNGTIWQEPGTAASVMASLRAADGHPVTTGSGTFVQGVPGSGATDSLAADTGAPGPAAHGPGAGTNPGSEAAHEGLAPAGHGPGASPDRRTSTAGAARNPGSAGTPPVPDPAGTVRDPGAPGTGQDGARAARGTTAPDGESGHGAPPARLDRSVAAGTGTPAAAGEGANGPGSSTSGVDTSARGVSGGSTQGGVFSASPGLDGSGPGRVLRDVTGLDSMGPSSMGPSSISLNGATRDGAGRNGSGNGSVINSSVFNSSPLRGPVMAGDGSHDSSAMNGSREDGSDRDRTGRASSDRSDAGPEAADEGVTVPDGTRPARLSSLPARAARAAPDGSATGSQEAIPQERPRRAG